MEPIKQMAVRVGEAIYTYWPGFSGRATRHELLAVVGAIIVLLFLIDGPWFAAPPPKSDWAGVVGLGRILIYPLLLWALFSATIRRFHDSGRSWLWFFTLLIPYVGFGFIVYAIMAGPDQSDNNHGPNPRHL